MSANRALSSPQYLRTPDAALHLGLSPRTLEKHRCYGTGPAFHKLGGRVVYTIDALDSWAALGLRRSPPLARAASHGNCCAVILTIPAAAMRAMTR